MSDQQRFVYHYDGDETLGPPAPGMQLCAKVYRGTRETSPGMDRVTLAAVGADSDAICETFLAGATGLRKVRELPPEVVAGLKIATDWVIGVLAGTPPPTAIVQ